MLDLWEVPGFYRENQEIVVATNIWTGVLDIPRPMATLYIAESRTHQPVTGTIVLIDDTEVDAQPGFIQLRLEGRPFHEFDPNVMLAPIIDKRYGLHDSAALARELREVIASHWTSNRYKSSFTV